MFYGVALRLWHFKKCKHNLLSKVTRKKGALQTKRVSFEMFTCHTWRLHVTRHISIMSFFHFSNLGMAIFLWIHSSFVIAQYLPGRKLYWRSNFAWQLCIIYIDAHNYYISNVNLSISCVCISHIILKLFLFW